MVKFDVEVQDLGLYNSGIDFIFPVKFELALANFSNEALLFFSTVHNKYPGF